MFNLGFTEMLIIGVIALLVVGPKQLPELARQAARMLNELKRATEEIGSTLKETKKEAQDAILKTRDEIMKQAATVVEDVNKEVKSDEPPTDSGSDGTKPS